MDGPTSAPTLLMTRKEVAAELRLSEKQIYNYTHAGLLTAIKLGKSVRYPRSGVEEFVANLRSGPSAK